MSGLEDGYVRQFLGTEAPKLLEWAVEEQRKAFVRSDYKELVDLMVLFLGGNKHKPVSIRAPGACHHARWMSKAIYSLKMFLFRSQCGLSSKEIVDLRDICLFIVSVYVKPWCAAAIPQMAPSLDLKMLKNILVYKDKCVAEVAISKFKNHLWYLTPEAAALSFFDSSVSNNTKRLMVDALQIKSQEDLSKKLTIEDIETISALEIQDFINSDSMKLFERYRISTTFFFVRS